ncbi:endonuclease/exonuclease/phosphatase family protein [Kineococcus sp. SYSU DK006]|uniref:endonuclease/exonuclease/phosphatase family protein n=1 Tax=Kineococcus sp. SYSU DK006 TaxID=3383127 RepID=UPI003D7E0CD4
MHERSRPVRRPARRPAGRPTTTAAAVLLTGAAAAGAVVALLPQWTGLAGTTPFAQAVAFRLPVGLGLGGLAALTGLAALRGRRLRRLLLPAASVLAVAAAGSLATTLTRGLGAGTLPPAQPGDVTVLAANVLHSSADPADVARLAVAAGADVLALPEADRAYADDVAARVRAATGTGVQVLFATDRDGRSGEGTALLVSERLGEYRATGELSGGLRAVVTAAPVAGSGPVLAAAHTAAPVPELLQEWRREVRAVADWCAATPGALLAGDLNATLDHPVLRLRGTCVDAGLQTGTAAHGTWPLRLPAALGATIDHALADGASWRAVGTRVEVVRGSDHRALLVRWRPVG